MINYRERRRPILMADGIHDFGAHCDNCASDLPRDYTSAIIYGIPVLLCSGRCAAQLLRVWAPSRRAWPVVEIIASVALVAMALL